MHFYCADNAEEEIITVEATENSAPEANHVQGENQIVPEGKDKDFHEEIDNQMSDGNGLFPIHFSSQLFSREFHVLLIL